MTPKVSYDSKGKILSIRLRPERSVDSDIQNNVVFDYDKKGHIVNIDIMHFNIETFIKSGYLKNKK